MSYPDLNRLLDAKFYKTNMKCSKKQGIIFAENNAELDQLFRQHNHIAATAGSDIRRKFAAAVRGAMTPSLQSALREEVDEAKAERARQREETKEDDGGPDAQLPDAPYVPDSFSEITGGESKVAMEDDPLELEAPPSVDSIEYTSKNLPALHSSLKTALEDGLIIVRGHKNAEIQLVDGRIEVVLNK